MKIRSERVQIPVGGASMPRYLSRPEDGGKYPGVLVFQEIFGVNRHIRSVVDRVAAEGYVALAPEPFHRSAPGIGGRTARFFGENDGYIPKSAVDRIRAALAKAGGHSEVVDYPGVGHGFFCDERGDYSETAAADAWGRVKTLFREELA